MQDKSVSPASTTGLHIWGCAWRLPQMSLTGVATTALLWWHQNYHQALRGIWWHRNLSESYCGLIYTSDTEEIQDATELPSLSPELTAFGYQPTSLSTLSYYFPSKVSGCTLAPSQCLPSALWKIVFKCLLGLKNINRDLARFLNFICSSGLLVNIKHQFCVQTTSPLPAQDGCRLKFPWKPGEGKPASSF